MKNTWILFSLLAASAAAANTTYRFERGVIPAGPGPNLLAVDAPLLAGASKLRYGAAHAKEGVIPDLQGGLEDLRLFTASGREIPYLLIPPPPPNERWEPASTLPIPATKAVSGFEAELRAPYLVGRLRVEGLPAPFLKRFRLEGSGDRARWTVLIGEGTLFDLPDEKLRQVEVAFSPGEFRYLRVTWDDRMSARLPLPRVAEFRVEGAPAASAAERTVLPFVRTGSEPGKSRFHLRLPGTRLPVVALQLAVGPGHLLRNARVIEPRLVDGEVVPYLLGASTLRQTTREDVTASDLRIPIAFPSGPDLDLVVDDGDNPPLDLIGVEAVFAPLPAIWFEASSAEPLVARFGNPALPAPRYDLEAARRAAEHAPAGKAHWSPVREVASGAPAAPESPLPEFGAPVERDTFGRFRTILAVKPGLNAVPLDAAVLAHGTLASLRIADEKGRQVPYLLEKREEPLGLDLAPPERLVKSASAQRVSAYRVLLPFAGLPASRLVLSTSARVFERPVSVQITRKDVGRREERVEIPARATWRHTDPETEATPLVLDLPRLEASEVTLTVDEGDNSPLPLSALRLLLPSYRLRFYSASDTGQTLLYGEPSLSSPRYDLALLAPRLIGVSSNDAALGPEGTNASSAKGTTDRRLFWGVLVAAVLSLLVLLGRLLRPDIKPPAPSA